MKPLINQLSGKAIFIFFPILFFWPKAKKIAIIVAVLCTFTLASCFQYYFRSGTQSRVDAATIQRLLSINKILIIHFNNRFAQLQNVAVTNNMLVAEMTNVQPEHLLYLHPDTIKANRVKKLDKTNTLMEVHLYCSQESAADQTHMSLPLSDFNRVDIYEFDKSTTTTNHVLSWVGLIVTPAAIALIVTAIACNCPQVCVNNNGNYQFVSGVYSGAVYSSLERTDYLPLQSLNAADKTFKIKIKNVKDEEQFMNRIQLLEVTHPAGTNVLADRHGNIFSYNKPVAPVSAIINQKMDIKKQIAFTDDDQYSFDSEKGENGLSNTILVFNKPVASKKAKLIIHGGNSRWSGYLYHSFAELFGTGYEKWRNQKDNSDPKEMEKWQTDQGLPLMVYVEKNGKWVFADYFAHTGNTASRDMIMELDLSQISSERVKIKLETVYQFWNLDFAGIDFSENSNATSIFLDPSKALRTDGTDQVKSLSLVDKDYAHLNADEEIDLEYQQTSLNERAQTSYFLVCTGYYHNMKKYEAEPKLATLQKFKNAKAFDDYSREKFTELENKMNSNRTAAKSK